MARDKFTCQRCNDSSGGNLCVHHDKERFAVILSKMVAGRQVPSLTAEEKQKIVDDIVAYHRENDVSGITLCRDCHRNAHLIDSDID